MGGRKEWSEGWGGGASPFPPLAPHTPPPLCHAPAATPWGTPNANNPPAGFGHRGGERLECGEAAKFCSVSGASTPRGSPSVGLLGKVWGKISAKGFRPRRPASDPPHFSVRTQGVSVNRGVLRPHPCFPGTSPSLKIWACSYAVFAVHSARSTLLMSTSEPMCRTKLSYPFCLLPGTPSTSLV